MLVGMRLALVLPPLTQLNTPYPSTGYLARHLREQGVACAQRDLGLELVLRLFSPEGLAALLDEVAALPPESLPEPAWRLLALRGRHLAIIGPVIAFLQGRDPTRAHGLGRPGALPGGPRVQGARLGGFGALGVEDRARHLCTLYLEDLADLVTATVDPGFALTRYQHHLALSPARFDPIAERLAGATLLDRWLDALGDTLDADVVGLSVPFPGNLYGALRLGQRLRARGVQVLLGGGYVNTELREVRDARLWGCVDAVMLDDGEGPLTAWLEWAAGGPDRRHRTLTPAGRLEHEAPRPAMTCAAWPGELPLDRYLNLLDSTNPAHRLWSAGRWNKLTVAHGCYWRRCAFCDVSLDYIGRYEAAQTGRLVDAVEELVAQTGVAGFHLVDEAAPPRGLKALALALLARGLSVTWWGNIRFERAFTPDLCRLLAASGCALVTGGLEVASDRLLRAMDKGVTVEQVARAAWAFRQAGVQVHAYLMYGFPGQTDAETLDSMELVRQLFAAGALQSAFWHRFVLTRHAPVFAAPERFGVRVHPLPPGVFADNDREHEDLRGGDHDRFDAVLPQALAAWMQGQALRRPVHTWFEPPLAPSGEAPDRIRRALAEAPAAEGRQLVWLGGEVQEEGQHLWLHAPTGSLRLRASAAVRQWLAEVLDAARPGQEPLALDEALAVFPGEFSGFEARWRQVRALGLVVV